MRNRPASLVVIEFGASWPRWLNPAQGGDLAVVAQHYEGAPEDLVTQVGSRVGRLAQGGWKLDQVVLVSNGRSDHEASAARSLLARSLMTHLKSSGGCHLTFSVSDTLGRRAAHDVNALAAALVPMAIACDVVLAVRVGDETPVYSRRPLARPLAAAG